MTDALDWRPCTGYSSRNSDVMHDLRIRKAMEHRAELAHGWAQQETYEAIEDFDHRMGYYMRKLPAQGPKVRVAEKRMASEQEERTMGISKTAVPRMPSPVLHYEYGAEAAPHKHLNLDGLKARPRTTATVAATTRPGTVATTRPGTSGFATYRDGTTSVSRGGFGVLGEDGAVSERPGTSYDTARSVHIVTKRNYQHPNTARGRIEGVMREVRTSNIWTPHSMLDPIFMPASLTQRIVTASSSTAGGATDRSLQSRKGKSRWEEGPGRTFVMKQRALFDRAMQRMDEKATQDNMQLADGLQRKRAILLVRAANKRDHAFMEAHERGEFYARQKLKQERKELEAARAEWEERERKKLALNRGEKEITCEAIEVNDEMDRFDRDMSKRREEAASRRERSIAHINHSHGGSCEPPGTPL